MRKVLLATVILLIHFSSVFSQSFLDSVKNGTPEEVQKAIEAGAIVNERDSDGKVQNEIKITAIKIISNDSNKPMYLDGGLLGCCPISKIIEVSPGTHIVSFFSKEDLQSANIDLNKWTGEYYKDEAGSIMSSTFSNTPYDIIYSISSVVDKSYSMVAEEKVKKIIAGTKSIYVIKGDTVTILMNYSECKPYDERIIQHEEYATKYLNNTAIAFSVVAVIIVVSLILNELKR